MKHLNKIPLVALFFFVIAPLLTFAHEFGHALLPLLEGETVIIKVSGYDGPGFDLGPLSIIYGGPWLPWVGHADWSGETQIMRIAMGPLTSIALATVIFFLLKKVKRESTSFLLKLSFCWLVGAFIVTAIPFNYPEFLIKNPTDKSDAKQIVDLLSN